MPAFHRYAIYYAPPEGSALAQFGASWLGWDAAAGEGRAHPDLPGLPEPVSRLTEQPRKYGFHGTLKPPFHLAEGHDVEGLAEAAAGLAAHTPSFEIPRIAQQTIGPFLALVPAEPSEPLADLAASCVRELDAFRAPPDAAELAKRRAGGLSAAQEANLLRWGYPYLFEEFRFHLTLTGPLDPTICAATETVLAPALAQILADPLPIREICLFGEEASPERRFHILTRFALSG
ncbi:MAG: DUF1045 domain-containing protein [Pseudomonadota bacterium]